MSNLNRRNKLVAVRRWQNRAQKYQDRLTMIPHELYLFMKAYLHGYLCGDGYVAIRDEKSRPNATHYEMAFFPDDKEMMETFVEIFQYLYLDRPKCMILKNHYCVRIKSKIACLDIMNEGSFGTLAWNVPTSLLVNDMNKMAWLRAFFDCEAYVGPRRIQVQSVNKNGLESVQRILLDLGISSRMCRYEREQKKWNTNYLLTIASQKERKKYLKTIGFNHAQKLRKLKESLTP